jgi:glycosyltransferase involved in cell wall biosynthesis
MRVMPLGLDLDRFVGCGAARGRLRAELGLAPDALTVGIVARLVPIKAHEVFLEAAGRLRRRLPRVTFVVVGDGERRTELEGEARRQGLQGHIHFLGWRQDLERIYADLDVVALTSRNEGSPVSLIEAMAAGRPVVATRVGGVPDLIEDGLTGALVGTGDAGALADAIGTLLADPDRRGAMGTAGRKRVLPAFGAERLLADIDRLYMELLRRKGLA